MSYWRKCLSTGDYQFVATGEPAPGDIVVQGWEVELARKDKRIAELYAELREEARLNNMGAEREAQLLTRIDELERDMKRFDWFKSAKCKAELECAKKAKRIAELEQVLYWLDTQGGLGYEKHAEIKKVLGGDTWSTSLL